VLKAKNALKHTVEDEPSITFDPAEEARNMLNRPSTTSGS
jgi:hypothetical protein